MIFGQSLAIRRAKRTAEINAGAAQLRRVFLTDIPGQDMIYAEKEAEARRWVQAESAMAEGGPEPDLDDYVWLAGEVGITAETASQLAQVWLNMAALWRLAGPAIEGLRLGSVAQVEAGTTLAEIDAAAAAAATGYAMFASAWGQSA